jgi:CHAP domain
MKWSARIAGCGASIVVAAFLAFLLMAGAVVASVLPASDPGSTAPVDGVPPLGKVIAESDALLPWVPVNGYPDRFPYGECTYWAAKNHLVTWNGDADVWIIGALLKGVPITSVPSVGAIVVYGAGHGYSSVGHVAIVVAAGGDSYTVSEMNYLGLGIVDERTISWPDPHVLGFIP